MIGVLGATGRTGGATVRHLVDRGLPVRAFTRHPDGSAAEALVGRDVEVTRADMGDAASLAAALDGVTALFSVQSAFDDRGRYRGDTERSEGIAVAEAAAAAGVRHVVQMAAGPGEPTGLGHFDTKLAIRDAIETRGIPVTALHPGPFMELMVDPSFAPALSVWGVEPRIVGWDRPLPWVAVDDIGRLAAEALAGPLPGESSVIRLVGDHRSLRECRTLLTEAGHRIRRFPLPTPLFRALVGDEFITMWRWIASTELPTVTSGLMGIDAWIERLPAQL
jgi:uncharacterized protein YbjT (DUF2867 family)